MPSRITVRSVSFAIAALALAACATSKLDMSTTAPSPDPRVGLRAGLMNAAEATWNLRVLSRTQPSEKFAGVTNSDLSFSGPYAIQGNYNGFQVWDISNPARPALKIGYLCPASQSDVSVYKNLLFVSGEGQSGRLDCGAEGVHDSVSTARLRGIRIFDITDIANPKYIGNVQTCRGSHTHTVVEDPNDKENVYVYVSGSAGVRSPTELAGCSKLAPDEDPNSALFRIEVIKVPLAHPELARIVSSPRIFNDLTEAPTHGEPADDIAAAAKQAADWRAKGGYTAKVHDMEYTLGPGFVKPMLDSIVRARSGSGDPTAADSAALRSGIQGIVDLMVNAVPPGTKNGIRPGPTQCHDITVYPAIGLAGGACGGYGLLLDIHDPANPRRLAAVADSNFSYWHSATFNNDGSDAVPELLQDARRADAQRELCGPQRVADPDSRARRDGPSLVSGRYLGVRLDRSVPSQGDRVLRSGPDRLDQAGGRRLVVRLLVQRRDRQLRDRSGTRHLRAAAQRLHLAE